MKDDKFKFVQQEKTDFLEPEATTETKESTELSETEKELKRKKAFRKRVFKAATLMFFVSTFLVLFGLFWQDDTSLMAIGDALWLAFAIELGIGWILFVYNHNIFSPLFHGVKTLGLMFVGKRPKDDYYTYMKNIEENPIPKFYYITVLTSAFILLIPALIILFIVW